MSESNKCMVKVNSKEELDTIRKRNAYVSTAYLQDGCPHCESMKVLLESECLKMKKAEPQAPFSIVHCPVNNRFCAEELINQEVDDYKRANNIIRDELTKEELSQIHIGVPVIVGRSKNGTSVFKAQGNGDAARKIVTDSFTVLTNITKGIREKMNSRKK